MRIRHRRRRYERSEGDPCKCLDDDDDDDDDSNAAGLRGRAVVEGWWEGSAAIRDPMQAWMMFVRIIFASSGGTLRPAATFGESSSVGGGRR